jgi:uncharacterized protein
MKSVFKILPAACLALGLAWSCGPAEAQGPAPAQQAPTLKPGTPACMGAAREILQMKNAGALYANAVPTIVTQTKDQLLSTNLNYQKDLNEVAVIVAQRMAGKEKEIGEGMAQIYCSEFSDKEIADLVTFYKSPLGQKLLSAEPRAIQGSMAYMNDWAQKFADAVTAQFRAEMRKRGKQI